MRCAKADWKQRCLVKNQENFLQYFHKKEKTTIVSSHYWYEERTDFSENAIGTSRVLHEEVRGFDVIQGQRVVRGKLLGGCLESLYDILSNTR